MTPREERQQEDRDELSRAAKWVKLIGGAILIVCALCAVIATGAAGYITRRTAPRFDALALSEAHLSERIVADSLRHSEDRWLLVTLATTREGSRERARRLREHGYFLTP